MDPFLDGLEHGPVCFVAHIPQRGMMEHTHAVVQDLFDGDVDVLPGVEDAGRDVFEDRGGDLTRGLVEDVGEVVLGKERVRGICAHGICPGFELMLTRGLEDAGRAGL